MSQFDCAKKAEVGEGSTVPGWKRNKSHRAIVKGRRKNKKRLSRARRRVDRTVIDDQS